MKTILTWFDARECRPIKNCNVLIITVTHTNLCNCMLEVSYENGHFNGEQFCMDDDVRYWALLPEAEDIFNAIKEEDDF